MSHMGLCYPDQIISLPADTPIISVPDGAGEQLLGSIKHLRHGYA
jgi:hypothetical protein